MGERKGVNKYYPPDWDPSKGSINEYVGQHPLRDRARKLGQGILVIRFEMPYNIWCGGCNNHIGMGVRYNAEKSKTGMYYTTPIYKFRMKCHLCDNYFEIQTDPKNHDYVILEGARRKEQRWDPKENEQIVPEDKATQKKMATDAMFKLEHGSDDIQKSKKAVASLTSLEGRRDEWKDDYLLNKMARQKFRDEKKAIKAESDSDSALLLKSSLDIPLQKETEEDIRLAGLIKYRALQSYEERQAEKRREIESRPLFEPASKVSRTEKLSPENKKLVVIKRTLQIARNSSQTSPFDRMKVDTLGIGGTTVNTHSLGIRRKSVSKLPSLSITPSENVEESSENDKDSCSPTNNPLNLREENCLPSNNSGTSSYSSQLPECEKCIHETVLNKTSDCSSNNCMDKQVNNEADEISELKNIKDLGKDETLQDSIISDIEKQTANNNTDVSTTGLRLVCSYSDTDSDS